MVGEKNNKNVNYKHQIFVYDNGHIFRYYIENDSIKKQEFNYIHFKKRQLPLNIVDKSLFGINHNGFFDIPSVIAQKDIVLSCKTSFLKEFIWKMKVKKMKLKNKINKKIFKK